MFHFNDLSPQDFEQLAGDLLSKETGVRFVSFKNGKDGGIDLLANINSEKVIVQAKRYLSTSFSSLKSACKNENQNWLNRDFKPDIYWLVTSLPLSKKQKEIILEIMANLPLTEERILGNEDLQSRLKENPEIVRAHMKLWLNESSVLDRFLKSDLYENTTFPTSQIKSSMKTYVEHGGLLNARRIIDEEGSVIISGPPGIGKTTLANMLLMQHIDEDWIPIVITEPQDTLRALNSKERRILYFDDFLGSVKLTLERLDKSERLISTIFDKAAIDPNLRFLLTSRDYILSGANQVSDRLSENNLNNKRYLLQLSEYTKLQKAKILYNHLYFSGLPRQHLDQILRYGIYNRIIMHENFNPRIIQTLTGRIGAENPAETYAEKFQEILDKPDILWSTAYHEHFNNSDKLLVLTVAIYGAGYWAHYGLGVPQCLDKYKSQNRRLKFDIPQIDVSRSFRKSLRKMEGGMLQIDRGKVSLSNPGVKGFLDNVLLEDGHLANMIASNLSNSELRSFYSQGNTLDPKTWQTGLETALNRNNIDLGMLSFILNVCEQKFSAVVSNDLISKALNQYLSSEYRESHEPIAIGKVLNSIGEYECTVDRQEDLITAIEQECQAIGGDDGDGLDMGGVVDFTANVVEASNSTPLMWEIGEQMADYVISAATLDVRDSGMFDYEQLHNDALYLEGVYGLSVEDLMLEIEDDSAYYYEQDHEYPSRFQRKITPKSEPTNHQPNQKEASDDEIISDMFKGL